jgi:hypothetical protein
MVEKWPKIRTKLFLLLPGTKCRNDRNRLLHIPSKLHTKADCKGELIDVTSYFHWFHWLLMGDLLKFLLFVSTCLSLFWRFRMRESAIRWRAKRGVCTSLWKCSHGLNFMCESSWREGCLFRFPPFQKFLTIFSLRLLIPKCLFLIICSRYLNNL